MHCVAASFGHTRTDREPGYFSSDKNADIKLKLGLQNHLQKECTANLDNLCSSFQVWQAIEKVLLEDSMCSPGAPAGEDGPQFTELSPAPVVSGSEPQLKTRDNHQNQLTELSPVPQLHIPDTQDVFMHDQDSCKVNSH